MSSRSSGGAGFPVSLSLHLASKHVFTCMLRGAAVTVSC